MLTSVRMAMLAENAQEWRRVQEALQSAVEEAAVADVYQACAPNSLPWPGKVYGARVECFGAC